MMKKYIKINKFLILLIILSVLLYRSFTYPSTLLYYYELFINCKFTYVKLLLILLVSMDIIYELITIYIINKYSILKKEPHLNKFIPSTLKSKILDLYEISLSCGVDKSLIINIKN